MKKMFSRKVLSFVAACALTAGFAASAFASNASFPKSLVIASGPLGGPWYSACTKMSEILMREIPGLNITVIEGGAESNIALVNAGGDAQIGMTSSMLAYPSITGKGENAKKADNVKAVMAILTSYAQIGTAESSNIKSIPDLVGKRFSAGKRGFISDIVFRRIAKEYDIDYKKITGAGGKVHMVSWGEYPQLVGDGHLDAFCLVGEVPHNLMVQIETSIPVRLLSVDKEKMEKILKEEPYLIGKTFPAGTYKGTKEAVNLLGYSGIFIANNNVSDEFLVKMVAIIQKNKDEIQKELPFVNLLGWDLVKSGIADETMRPAVLKLAQEQQGK